MFLDNDTFRSVINSTPLVSIDLILKDSEGNALLGQRRNRPAMGYWFVPGGRILKNEALDEAFRRLTKLELGREFERNNARPIGVYEHFYDDSVFGEAGYGPDTHYVVLAYQLTLPGMEVLELPTAQHGVYRWWHPSDARLSADVHENTRVYFDAI
ncbi:GDP-mannose mannosyl hydrolase [Metapseudomonas resinovorans]|uniref:GDP-mannose mannosyl hydrolase n=1 Tax=Metapseudomonas resinovorans TaxID=53412 RepID=UPI000986B36E|nr:GDP-mannose mannosyl hydrolase [Pseudomonas resinovorans]GLZ88437.1 GDP-mannose mannosyl hydrolase [Pseudomonas resinovorans]